MQGEIRGEASVLRSGKNASQIEVKIFSGDSLATQCLGILGTALDSVVSVAPLQPVLKSERALDFPYVPGVTPNFTQHFGMRLLSGNIPFSGKETRTSAYQLQLKDEGPTSLLHVAALADVVPPLGLSYLRVPTFGSTMSWMLEFLVQPCADLSLSGWRLDSELVSAAGGYTNQHNTLWSPEGQAFALSRQCMMIFG